VNVAAPAHNDAAAAAQIQALANPQTAKALQNLQDLLATNVLTLAEFHAAKDKLLGIPHAVAPAGWYDDGSGRLRWWDGHQWTGHFAAAAVPPATQSHNWWVWSPAYTLGLFAFIPALHAAIKLQRRALWLWAAGLIAGDVVVWGLLSVSPSDPDGSATPIESVGAFIAMALAVVGTIHAFRVRDEVFGTSRADGGQAGAPARLDPAVADSLAARKRRSEAAALSAKDPGLARDLRIGRPDLARQYDDGGLVDVNHVPEAFLVSHLGLSPEQARTVIEARDHIGGFQSVTELSGLADVPPKTLDAIRDRIVTL
jgi:DNA uptake protein ComE-like DNA-binding protein